MNKLEIPCAYQGGKQRIANQIIDIIFKNNNINENTKFYDLCCGTGSISIELVNRGIKPENITMVDLGVFGLFYKMIGNGEFDIEKFKKRIDVIPIDKNEIQNYLLEINRSPLKEDYIYDFLILQAGSFGGKQISLKNNQEWEKATFRNYWQPTETSNRRSPVNPMQPMKETLYKRVELICEQMRGVNGFNCDIKEITPSPESIVYIDPPYMNTSKYKHDIDVIKYVNTIKGCKVYLSEGIALTENAVCLSEGRLKGGISGNRTKKPNEEWLSEFAS